MYNFTNRLLLNRKWTWVCSFPVLVFGACFVSSVLVLGVLFSGVLVWPFLGYHIRYLNIGRVDEGQRSLCVGFWAHIMALPPHDALLCDIS